MPGPQVKNWDVYHALRRRGRTKQSAARIANAQAAGTIKRGRGGRKRARS